MESDETGVALMGDVEAVVAIEELDELEIERLRNPYRIEFTLDGTEYVIPFSTRMSKYPQFTIVNQHSDKVFPAETACAYAWKTDNKLHYETTDTKQTYVIKAVQSSTMAEFQVVDPDRKRRSSLTQRLHTFVAILSMITVVLLCASMPTTAWWKISREKTINNATFRTNFRFGLVDVCVRGSDDIESCDSYGSWSAQHFLSSAAARWLETLGGASMGIAIVATMLAFASMLYHSLRAMKARYSSNIRRAARLGPFLAAFFTVAAYLVLLFSFPYREISYNVLSGYEEVHCLGLSCIKLFTPGYSFIIATASLPVSLFTVILARLAHKAASM